MDNINVFLADLPISVKGFVKYFDDFYTIVLNCNLSREQNEISYLHELEHIKNGDYDSKSSIGIIEQIRHYT